jgi:hypothetical protein
LAHHQRTRRKNTEEEAKLRRVEKYTIKNKMATVVVCWLVDQSLLLQSPKSNKGYWRTYYIKLQLQVKIIRA